MDVITAGPMIRTSVIARILPVVSGPVEEGVGILGRYTTSFALVGKSYQSPPIFICPKVLGWSSRTAGAVRNAGRIRDAGGVCARRIVVYCCPNTAGQGTSACRQYRQAEDLC
jgi:hypothetical protein